MSSRKVSGAVLVCSLLMSGCASLLPVGSVLKSMEGDDVDVVIGKVTERYPNVGRFMACEGFVISLDSIVVGLPFRGDQNAANRELVQTTVSYMLGETVGKQWISRVGNEDAVFGEGFANLLVYRSGDGKRYLLDVSGFFSLVLPLGGGARRREGIELVTFDLRSSNQPIDLAGDKPISVYAEVLPRNAIYSGKGPIFRNWANSTFHLSWRPGLVRTPKGKPVRALPAKKGDPLPSARTDEDRLAMTKQFLNGTRPLIGPLVRLQIKFHKQKDGSHVLTYAKPNRVELVLPNSLVAGNRALEQAVERIAKAFPGYVQREGSNLLIAVGHFFFYSDTTGPRPTTAQERARNEALKVFRIPPPKRD